MFIELLDKKIFREVVFFFSEAFETYRKEKARFVCGLSGKTSIISSTVMTHPWQSAYF